MGPAPAIELVGIVAGYGGPPVLRGVNLRVEPGDMVGISGPNGAGKTTLLRVILGLLVPGEGQVRLFGEPLRDERSRRRARLRIGYVPQEQAPGALPMTVWDAVLMGRWGRGFAGPRRPGPADRQAARMWIERLGLGPFAQRDVRELSGGQRQRVALARALAGEPSLLILDEPTTHLDAGARRDFMECLAAFHREAGVTTVFVTHDPGVLAGYARRRLRMEAGRLAPLPVGGTGSRQEAGGREEAADREEAGGQPAAAGPAGAGSGGRASRGE